VLKFAALRKASGMSGKPGEFKGPLYLLIAFVTIPVVVYVLYMLWLGLAMFRMH
jgi:hypothetical protein